MTSPQPITKRAAKVHHSTSSFCCFKSSKTMITSSQSGWPTQLHNPHRQESRHKPQQARRWELSEYDRVNQPQNNMQPARSWHAFRFCYSWKCFGCRWDLALSRLKLQEHRQSRNMFTGRKLLWMTEASGLVDSSWQCWVKTLGVQSHTITFQCTNRMIEKKGKKRRTAARRCTLIQILLSCAAIIFLT